MKTISKHISALLVIVLSIIAFIVFCGLVAKQNMWLFIVSYWLVLTIKNVIDFIGVRNDLSKRTDKK